MLYKWLGSGILLLAGGYLSVFFSRMEKKRLTVLDSYISLLRFIKGQIDCYATPIHHILTLADPSLLSLCMGQDGEGSPQPYPISLDLSDTSPLLPMIAQSRLYLEPESERLLLNFATELGQTYRAEQVMRCEHYIGALGEERRKLAEASPQRVRMSSILCLCSSLGLVVLLW